MLCYFKVAVEFRDLDSDDVVTKVIDVDLTPPEEMVQMIEEPVADLETKFVTSHLAGSGLTPAQARAAIQEIADQLYRPAWKGV